MPRPKKVHENLNPRIDAAIYRREAEVSAEAGQTKTLLVERALQAYLDDYDRKQEILRQAEEGKLVPLEGVKQDEI